MNQRERALSVHAESGWPVRAAAAQRFLGYVIQEGEARVARRTVRRLAARTLAEARAAQVEVQRAELDARLFAAVRSLRV